MFPFLLSIERDALCASIKKPCKQRGLPFYLFATMNDDWSGAEDLIAVRDGHFDYGLKIGRLVVSMERLAYGLRSCF